MRMNIKLFSTNNAFFLCLLLCFSQLTASKYQEAFLLAALNALPFAGLLGRFRGVAYLDKLVGMEQLKCWLVSSLIVC